MLSYAAIMVILLASGRCSQPDLNNTLSEDLFRNPPESAKPRTWMHAMSGNITAEGLTKDLESIQQVGIGGVLRPR